MIRRFRAPGSRSAVLLAAVALAIWTVPAFAQPATGGRSADGVWQLSNDSNRPAAQRRADLVGAYAVAQLDRAALAARLADAPHEAAANRGDVSVVVTLPLPDGRFSRFRIEESPILAPELAAAFPEFKTYRGFGLDDPTATARLDVTAAGFHGQIIAAGGTVYIDPYAPDDLVTHVSYDKATLRRGAPRPPDDVIATADVLERTYNSFPITNGTSLRTYRLALAANGEYTTAAGGTKPLALSRMTTTMNRVNGIYERELAVRMTVSTGTLADPTLLIYTNAAGDPYSNSSAAINENQTNLDTVIGSANYDIGHVFTTGSGGVAQLQAVCNATGKARGTTGLGNPVGDAFDVDYVAHEMGHQFGGNHTFNSSVGNCSGGNRSPSHAFEVGSGSTIQAYAGICGAEDLQAHSDDIFTFESLNEMTAFITNAATGASCGTASANGNTLPVVTVGGAAFTIPANTPFELTASATDANGDALTYLWEEHDLGTASTGANAWIDDGSRPLFRSFAPSTSGTRTFPSLTYILNNANVPPTTSGGFLVGEALPTTNRTMQFHVTVRDNRAGGGGINTAQTSVTVSTASGPFQVTSPNTAISVPGGSAQTISWAVNGTNALAANVAILFSNNGGSTFPTVLAASTPNDGSETVSIPVGITSTARIKVIAVGNIFFDISDTNFSVSAAGPPPGAFAKTAPANGATGVVANPTLSWAASTGAATYEYCLDTTANAACDAAWVSTGSATSVGLSALAPGTAYSWQIRAVNGSGNTPADSGTWWTFTTAAASNPLGDIVLDFGSAYGLWAYYDASGTPAWQQKHGFSPTNLAIGDYDGNGRADIFVTFAGYGVWAFMNDTTWVNLHPLDATTITTGDVNGNGRADVIVTFATYGTWVLYDSGGWMQLHPLTPSVVAVGNIDSGAGGRADVIVSFGSAGTWAWMNNTSWSQTHALPTTNLVVADVDGNGIGDLIAQFAGYGEYILYNNTTWTPLHNLQASGIVAGNIDGDGSNRADVIVNFPGVGVWAWMNNTSWVQLHGLNPAVIAVGDVDGNGQADLVMDFRGFGIYVYRNNSLWIGIHNLPAEAIVSGRVNAN